MSKLSLVLAKNESLLAIYAPTAMPYYPFLDLVRVIACYLVILLHVAAVQFGSFFQGWKVAALYDSIARMSVPLFFMISGFLLLDSNISSLSRFYFKRYARILIPFLIICFFYYFTTQYKNYTAQDYIFYISTHFVDYHLWYVYTLIGLYLALPFFIKIIHGNEGQKLAYLYLGIWTAAFIIAPMLNITGRNNIPALNGLDPATAFHYVLADLASSLFANFNFIFFYGYFGYFICGWLIRHHIELLTGSIRYMAFITFIIATGALYWLTINRSLILGEPDQLYFNNLSPFVVVQALAFFIFCCGFKKGNLILHDISDKSYWIYLIHILLLRLFVGICPLPLSRANIFCIPLYTTVVFITGYFAAIPLRAAELRLLKIL